MSYVLGGSNGESNGFEKSIASFALRAVHESNGLVNATTVVVPTQGNTFVVPKFAPITFQDYNPAGTGGDVSGDASEQNPAISQSSITATPAVATTAFDIFYGYTTSFQLAATLGQEIGDAFSEKVDQRVAASFALFKATPGHTMYATSADGFARVSALGAMELRAPGVTAGTAVPGFTSATVLELIRNVKLAWKNGRLSGSPVVVLDAESQNRLLGELTGGAVSQSGGANLSAIGNELLMNGRIENIYGVSVMFSTFLPTASRAIAGGTAETVKIGAYIGDGALYTVLKNDLEIKSGEKPGGLQQWLTGVAFMGAGVGDGRRGGAINLEQA